MAIDTSPAAQIARIDETLAEIALNGSASYGVNGRTFTALDIDKLLKLRSFYSNLQTRQSRRMFAPISFNPMR
jgi:hypothetical protein